jgi:hypothetical protein
MEDTFFEKLDRSIRQAEEGNLVTFNMEELEIYIENLITE